MHRLSPRPFGFLALLVLASAIGCKGEEAAPPAGTATPPASSASSPSSMASPNETRPGAPTAESAPSTGKAMILKAEVIPVNEALPKGDKTIPHFQVIWEWKNDGTTPIGILKGDVRAYDKAGKLTYESLDTLLFAKYDDEKEAIAPGATNRVKKGQGHSMKDLSEGDPIRAEITITYAGPVTKLPG